MKTFLSRIGQNPDLTFRLVNQRSGRVIAERLQVAFDSASRNKGLLGRGAMEAGSALILAPTNAIHTWFMRFAIDVAFVAKDGRILKTRPALRPWRMAASFRAFAVVELPAGTLAESGTSTGDYLLVHHSGDL